MMRLLDRWLMLTIALFIATCMASVCLGMGMVVKGDVKCGIDNLIDTQFSLLQGKRLVLVTHAAARAQTGRSTLEEFRRRTDLTLLRVLTPEHGYYGVAIAGSPVAHDTINDITTLSLYGALRKPNAEMIADADVVVVDLQDIGTRSYTYISTMVEVMEACAEHSVPVMILDRPNPIGGNVVDGNIPEDTLRSFVARIPVAYVHGMTMGELAVMTNGERWLGKDAKGLTRQCSLTVVRCKRWTHEMRFEDTNLPWYPTSPNIPTVHAARGYPVTGLLGELGGVYIGIGSPSPFTVVGAPYLTFDTMLVQRLKRHGTIALPARFVPATGRFAGMVCNGYYLAFNAVGEWHPYMSALTLIAALYPATSEHDSATGNDRQTTMFKKVSGSSTLLSVLTRADWSTIEREGTRGLTAFKVKRRQYLLYP